MKIGTGINYARDFHSAVAEVVELEKAGLDVVWVSEAYSFDAVSRVGYLAAATDTVEIGTGILNVYSRSAAAIAQTAAGCDYVSNGRFILGLGASGPQVIEGFHGIAYDKPVKRIREYIEVTRMVLKRERLEYDGDTIQLPLPEGEGTGLGKALKLINHPVRDEVPIWWASLMPYAIRETARLANGWIPTQFLPEHITTVWGDDLAEGMADRPAELGPLQISKGATVAIGDEFSGEGADPFLDRNRPHTALYWGGMGAREQNFYNSIARLQGYEEEAVRIQDLYLDGHKDEAAAAVPRDFLDRSNLVGPESVIRERLGSWKAAGVTHLNVSLPGPDAAATLGQLREILADV